MEYMPTYSRGVIESELGALERERDELTVFIELNERRGWTGAVTNSRSRLVSVKSLIADAQRRAASAGFAISAERDSSCGCGLRRTANAGATPVMATFGGGHVGTGTVPTKKAETVEYAAPVNPWA